MWMKIVVTDQLQQVGGVEEEKDRSKN